MPATGPFTCLSPHSDDAALSCGGTLALLAATGRPAHIITVFAGPAPPPEQLSPLARQLHHDWGDLPDPIAHRRREDACALKVLGCTGTWWSYRDAIYRHPAYDSPEHLFAPPADEGPLQDRLYRRCAALRGEILLFPLAVGGHVDHRLLFRAGWRLAQAGRPVAFYEDLPYAAWGEGPVGRLAELPAPLHPQTVEVEAGWPAKIAAVSCYSSQLSSLSHDGLTVFQGLERYASSIVPGGYGERIWHLAEERWI